VRFTEYVTRFVRLASRYEEDVTGSTKFGYPSFPFTEATSNRPPQLGSGIVFSDEATRVKELSANANRIEGWRRTNSYQYCVMVCTFPPTQKTSHICLVQDFSKFHSTNTIKGFDVLHQLFRLRHAKKMPDSEVALIMRTFANNVKSYDQVIEVSISLSNILLGNP